MASSATPVTRIACFRFKSSVTPEQKGDRARAFLGLYRQHRDLIIATPVGGKPLNTPLNLTNVKRDSVWDLGFIVSFKSEEARQQFDKEDGHDKLKVSLSIFLSANHYTTSFYLMTREQQEETDPLLEQVFVYDFEEEENLGW
ncbi:hypothetical protein D0864_13653 [Hortaea werneckii]|uniref:Stress-response A/B barrel domain-containing protein n=1 Tax=Hortaea werneckii TaxID=91943 RepID=A0A3M7CWE1_HORWE|nr:hypothetical protein D0864_13653 [Hortaea werneckii]